MALGLMVMQGCGRKPAPPRTVVLISVDTLRADHLPAYGYRSLETPAIDALRRDSILFENAYSHVPLTLPSHATLLTGLLPYDNGVRDNAGFRLAESHATLASFLRARGFDTGAAVSSYVLRRDRGLAAGFDFYDDAVGGTRRERAGVETVAVIEKWARSRGDRPLFVFLHIYEPHAPYDPPEPFRTRYARNLYDGEIAAADSAVGGFLSFLKAVGRYDDSVIFLLGDHGEGLGDHGEEEHGVFIYQEDVHVPLLLKLPRSASAGASAAAPAALTDVFPTVVDLLGAPPLKELTGLSLRGLIGASAPARDIYSESLYPRFALGWSDLAALENGRSQYIEAPRPEFYDLASDPGERKNLASSRPPELRRMRAKLVAASRPMQGPEASSAEEARSLASLGYLSGSGAGTSGSPGPDPKDHVRVLASFRRVFELHAADRFAEVVPLAREVVSEDPLCFSVWEMLSDSLMRTGKLAAACDVLDEGIAKAGGAVSTDQLTQAYDNLSVLLGRAGQAARRRTILERAAGRHVASPAMINDLARMDIADGRGAEAIGLLSSLTPRDPAALNTMGIALAGAGKADEARAAFEGALAIDAHNAEAACNLGTLLLQAGSLDAAAEWFERAGAWNPKNGAAFTSLGLARIRAGRSREAQTAWKQALAADPSQYEAMFNLGMLLLQEGSLEEGRRYLSRFEAEAPAGHFAEQRAVAARAMRSARNR
jgi:choline-sulfatase